MWTGKVHIHRGHEAAAEMGTGQLAVGNHQPADCVRPVTQFINATKAPRTEHDSTLWQRIYIELDSTVGIFEFFLVIFPTIA